MQFVVKRDILLKSLNFVQGVVEKKNTLPILSNVLIQLKDKKLSIVATDLDIIFYDEISEVKILKEGSTTTSAAIIYDILRKISSNAELNFELKSENKLSLKSENDSHRLSSSSLEIDNATNFTSLILPRKTVFQLCSLLSESSDQLTMQTSDNKIKFNLGNMKLISKVIDGKFPDYKKVVPTTNEKTLVVSSKEFINSIERVASVSLDRKEGVKLLINKDNVQLSVNSANSGEGNEKMKAQFNAENLNISFNSKYLIDIASEVEDKNIKINLKDSVSPVLIEDISDKNSYYVIMPMKI